MDVKAGEAGKPLAGLAAALAPDEPAWTPAGARAAGEVLWVLRVGTAADGRPIAVLPNFNLPPDTPTPRERVPTVWPDWIGSQRWKREELLTGDVRTITGLLVRTGPDGVSGLQLLAD